MEVNYIQLYEIKLLWKDKTTSFIHVAADSAEEAEAKVKAWRENHPSMMKFTIISKPIPDDKYALI